MYHLTLRSLLPLLTMACLTACPIWKHWHNRLCMRLCVRVCERMWQESHTLLGEKCESLWHIISHTLLRPLRRSVKIPTAGCVSVCVCVWCHADGVHVLQQVYMPLILIAEAHSKTKEALTLKAFVRTDDKNTETWSTNDSQSLRRKLLKRSADTGFYRKPQI